MPVPTLGSSQPTVALVLGYPAPSTVLRGYCMHIKSSRHTHIHKRILCIYLQGVDTQGSVKDKDCRGEGGVSKSVLVPTRIINILHPHYLQAVIIERLGRRILLLSGYAICCSACLVLTVALLLQVCAHVLPCGWEAGIRGLRSQFPGWVSVFSSDLHPSVDNPFPM